MTFPRLVREVAATPGLARLRQLDRDQPCRQELVAALRESPGVEHLHVPLQSGDDAVARNGVAAHRRGPRAARGRVQLDDRRDPAFRPRTRRRSRTRWDCRRAGSRASTCSRTAWTAQDDPVRLPSSRSGARGYVRSLAESSGAAGRRRSAATTSCWSTVPVGATGTAYSPFLVDAPVGELLRVRQSRHRRGNRWRRRLSGPVLRHRPRGHLRCNETLRRDRRHQPTGGDPHSDHPQAPGGSLPRDLLVPSELKRMLEFAAEVARDAGLVDYRVQANVGRKAPGRRSSTSTCTCSATRSASADLASDGSDQWSR